MSWAPLAVTVVRGTVHVVSIVITNNFKKTHPGLKIRHVSSPPLSQALPSPFSAAVDAAAAVVVVVLEALMVIVVVKWA